VKERTSKLRDFIEYSYFSTQPQLFLYNTTQLLPLIHPTMSVFFRSCTCFTEMNPNPDSVQSCLKELGFRLLQDTRFSPFNRFRLEKLLSLDLSTLRIIADLDEGAASLYDIISYIVTECCPELTGLTTMFHAATNKISVIYQNELAPTADPETEDDYSAPPILSALDLHPSTSEKIVHVTIADPLYTPVPANLIQMILSTTTTSSADDYSDDDDVFEHQQRKDASDVSINDSNDTFEHQQRKDASDVGILTNPSPTSAQRKDASDSNILTLNRLKHQENDEFHTYDDTTTKMKLMTSESFEEDHTTKNDDNHTKVNPNNNDTEFNNPKRNYVSVLHDTKMSPSSHIVALDGSTFNVNINVHQNLTKHGTEKDPSTIHHSSHDLTMPDTKHETPSVTPSDMPSVSPSNSDTPSHDVALHDTEYDTTSISPSDTPTVSPRDTPSVSPSSEASLYNYWENDSGDRYYSDVQDVFLDEYPSESDYDDDDDENHYYSGSSVEI